MTSKAIGAMELSSVGVGYRIQDEMLKAANIDLLLARTICSGKYLIVIGGSVSDVQSAVSAGAAIGGEALIDQLMIPAVDSQVFEAMSQSVILEKGQTDALGIIETYSGVSILDAADAAVKAAKVRLFRVHIAMALGGKGFALMTGSVSDVEAAVKAGAEKAISRGLLVSQVVIPRPSAELFGEYI